MFVKVFIDDKDRLLGYFITSDHMNYLTSWELFMSFSVKNVIYAIFELVKNIFEPQVVCVLEKSK